jgi:hypothetical protein
MHIKVLIPAAGYGTRMGRPESKEMLFRPDGQRFIDHALNISKKIQAIPHVIVRRQKKNLIQHLELLNISFQLVDETHDWPETLLLSESNWGDFNLVLLPDTDFGPESVLNDMIVGMQQGNDLVAACFACSKFEDYFLWGVMGSDGKYWYGCEKPNQNSKLPKTLQPSEIKAWGLFGFSKKRGVLILNKMLESTMDHHWKKQPIKHQFYSLEFFKDLTR